MMFFVFTCVFVCISVGLCVCVQLTVYVRGCSKREEVNYFVLIVSTRLTTILLLLSPGTRISTFTQADIASRSIQYVHTSEEEKHADQFSFTVSDGTNEVNEGVDTLKDKKGSEDPLGVFWLALALWKVPVTS